MCIRDRSYRLIKDKITEEEKRRIMEVIIDRICNNLDFNDTPEMIMVCILLIILFAKCIGPFFASDIEVILMKKKGSV